MPIQLPRIVAVLGLLGFWVPAVAGPLNVVSACARLAAPGVGLDQLEKQCPQLEQALVELQFTPLLTPEVRTKLTSVSLQDFVALALRYQESHQRAGPPTVSLKAIAAELNGEQPPAVTWFERLKAWVKQWLARYHLSAGDWFNRWWDRLLQSKGFLTVVGDAAMALVVLLAVGVILNELRALGFWRGGKRPANARPEPQATLPVERISPRWDRYGISELLNRIVARLIDGGRLAREHGLTHRELITQSRLDTPSQQAAFAELAGSAELLRYGPPQAAQRDFTPVIAQGQDLLAQLTRTEPA